VRICRDETSCHGSHSVGRLGVYSWLEGFLAWRGSSTTTEVRLRSRQSKNLASRSGIDPLLQLEDWYFMTNSDSNHQKWDRSSSSSAGSIPSHPRIRLNLWLFVKPINLPDRGVIIGRIPRHFPRRESAAEFPCCWPLLAITHMCMLPLGVCHCE
jgi:hypothetical protein